ncbi:MAG: excinuclease ABC subunit UvrC [Candidatus Margulisbacteria bacterium]|nr:excinuclease ABC subunit UvrC [Candidatus Margulisiibacteriota bacterium]
MSSLQEKLKTLPAKPGVYLFKGRAGEIIYVGKARVLRQRVASYFQKNGDLKTSILVSKLRDIDYIVTASELDALILEDKLVKKYKPRYNIALKDDKAYPFLKLTINEKWPRLFLVRRKENDGALYYGRYQGGMVRAIVRLVKKLFPIRWCKESPLKNREQPCLYARIGACSAPCVGNISTENYHQLVAGIKLLLEGKMAQAIGQLKSEMEKASKDKDYERAAYFRDSIKLLEKMLEGKADLAKTPAPLGLSELTELQKGLKLPAFPMRIECFDVSNIQGSNIVASMVVFLGGAPLRRDYRRFKIQSVKGKPNDVMAIYEAVKRRYAGSLSTKMDKPDLVMVDGGAAQVSFAGQALSEAKIKGIPLIGLAKKEELVYLPDQPKPIRLERYSAALKLLQRIRDEAHRFAVTFHREKRKKAFFG